MILITAPVHPYLLETLTRKGHAYQYIPDIDENGLLSAIHQATGLIVTTRLTIGKKMMDLAPNLKWIGRLGSGMEMIDTEYATLKHIRYFSSPEGNCQSVAEHALGMLLSLLHHLHRSVDEVKQGLWRRAANRGKQLQYQTVGIIGYGHTGPAFAHLLEAFSCKLLVNDPYKEIKPNSRVKAASLEQICQEATVISFHVPLSPETNKMADTAFFQALKQQPLIINTSRGNVIDTVSLIAALEQQQVAGAALDVLENEKINQLTGAELDRFTMLVNHPAVLITPHIAGYSDEAFLEMAKVLLEKIEL